MHSPPCPPRVPSYLGPFAMYQLICVPPAKYLSSHSSFLWISHVPCGGGHGIVIGNGALLELCPDPIHALIEFAPDAPFPVPALPTVPALPAPAPFALLGDAVVAGLGAGVEGAGDVVPPAPLS